MGTHQQCDGDKTDLVSLRVEEEVGPVWIGLHVSELKKLPQAQTQDLLADLSARTRAKLLDDRVCGKISLNYNEGEYDSGVF